MIPLLIWAAAAAAQTPAPATEPGDLQTLQACAALAEKDPQAAIDQAQAWRLKGGDIPARQCMGMAYMAQGRAAPAALTFEQAARAAEAARDGRVSELWGQAGNAWLAAGEAAKARTALDAALVSNTGTDPWKGELYIDRARADVEFGDMKMARADLDKALQLVPDDPMGWLLSATLARREHDIARAATDIAKAIKLAPDDADVALEAGNIAGLQGDIAAARDEWAIAVKRGAGTGTAKAAQAALDANPAP